VAIITTDHRAESEEQLEILGITHLLDSMVCGDDGIPTKPAPDALLATCQRLGCKPARTMVVGDTTADLLMARNAGAGLVVAVLTGAGTQASLSNYADVIVESITGIHVKDF
jgi:phosphoglycolate phosphatase-like HAD superfamily hydrolase